MWWCYTCERETPHREDDLSCTRCGTGMHRFWAAADEQRKREGY